MGALRGMEGGGMVRGMQSGRYEECLSVCLCMENWGCGEQKVWRKKDVFLVEKVTSGYRKDLIFL